MRLAWALGVGHSLGEGTDAGEVWFLAMTGVAVIPVLVLLLAGRTMGLGRRRAPAATTAQGVG